MNPTSNRNQHQTVLFCMCSFVHPPKDVFGSFAFGVAKVLEGQAE